LAHTPEIAMHFTPTVDLHILNVKRTPKTLPTYTKNVFPPRLGIPALNVYISISYQYWQMHSYISRSHVLTLKGPSSGYTFGTFKQQGHQNKYPYVKFWMSNKIDILFGIKYTPWRRSFKGWNMLQWYTVLIKWWPNNKWLHLSVFTRYSDTVARIWTR
jgi:hypothetical protein